MQRLASGVRELLAPHKGRLVQNISDQENDKKKKPETLRIHQLLAPL
jgi:hypothetical protein